jgi:serine/threonine protein kinase
VRVAILLPYGTRLHDQYLVGQVLGKPGGFGITYLGWNLHLETRVAIKEYLPREWAGRSVDHASVKPHFLDEGDRPLHCIACGCAPLSPAVLIPDPRHPFSARVRHPGPRASVVLAERRSGHRTV